jgi:hypothetical protein
MNLGISLAIAGVGLGGARLADEWAKAEPMDVVPDEPYAPSVSAAPIVTVGYREVAADMLFIRLTGYFGGNDASAAGIGALVEAILALDPHFYRVYDYGAVAMTIARHGVDQDARFHAIEILERGMKEFPNEWKLPYRAGELYLHDLVVSKDPELGPKQRREWDEKAVQLFESATRKPNADMGLATELIATLQTKYGHRERAIAGLREMLLITTDASARKRLIERLGEISHEDTAEIAAEVLEAQHRFDTDWKSHRPALPPTMFVLLGDELAPGFDPVDLATGGRDLVGSKPFEHLEPLE